MSHRRIRIAQLRTRAALAGAATFALALGAVIGLGRHPDLARPAAAAAAPVPAQDAPAGRPDGWRQDGGRPPPQTARPQYEPPAPVTSRQS